MPASIGHNNPPFDFFAFFDAIVSSSASAQQKLIQLVIARQAQKAGGSARPRRADVLHQASCSEATFKRAYDLLKVGFNVTPHRGSTTEYTPRECVTVEQIEAAIARMPHKTRAQGDTSFAKTGGHRARVSVNPGSPSDGLSDTSFGKSGDHSDTKSKERSPHTPLKENINIYNTPLSKETARARGRGVLDDPFGLNPHMRGLREDVWVDADDRLQVGNGFRVELEGLAGGPEQLRIELDMAAEWVGLNHPPQTLKAKVRGRVLKQITERKDRDRRYEQAKKDNEKSRQINSDPMAKIYSGVR